MNRDVEMALNAVKEAQISLQVECRKAYPRGTQVHVKLGAAKVVLNVDGHSRCYWSDPGAMYGVNIKTGKRREFHDSDVLEVIFKPELGGPGKSQDEFQARNDGRKKGMVGACPTGKHEWQEIGEPDLAGTPTVHHCIHCTAVKRV